MAVNQLRVLVLTDIYPHESDPLSGIFIKALNHRLKERCRVLVIHPIHWFELLRKGRHNPNTYFTELEKIPAYRPAQLSFPKVDRIFLRAFFFLIAVLTALKRSPELRNIDIIHGHMAVPGGFAASILGKILKKPVLVTCHGSDINTYPHMPVLGALVRYTLKNSHCLVTVSKQLKTILRNYNSRAIISTIKNGAEDSIFFPAKKIVARKKLNLPINSKIIVYVGNLTKEKGLLHLVNSLKKVLQSYPNLIAIFIGSGYWKDELISMSDSLGIGQIIRRIGSLRQPEVANYIRASDLICLPSLSEGLPMVSLEAISCGRPLVATKVGGLPEVITKELGILVPPADEKALASALVQALGHCWNEAYIAAQGKSYSWTNTAVNGRLEVSHFRS